MAQVLVYNNDEGGVSIVTPVGPISDALKALPVGISSYSILDDSNLPSDRNFRNAWKATGLGNTTVSVGEDITSARELHKTNIRVARAPKLAALDVEFQKAQETSAGITTIVAKKQALRDAPAAAGIATAANTTELKAQWDTSILGDSPYS
tara:strand:+ start:512 stop:964 length:453 start_codon:yes stop_codon:yes gene_type:complete